MIHRDLKPANIMLDAAGKVRLMDFGLETVGEPDLERRGTPAYMASESRPSACKINPGRFDSDALATFRTLSTRGRNYLLCPDIDEPYDHRAGTLIVRTVGCEHLLQDLS